MLPKNKGLSIIIPYDGVVFTPSKVEELVTAYGEDYTTLSREILIIRGDKETSPNNLLYSIASNNDLVQILRPQKASQPFDLLTYGVSVARHDTLLIIHRPVVKLEGVSLVRAYSAFNHGGVTSQWSVAIGLDQDISFIRRFLVLHYPKLFFKRHLDSSAIFVKKSYHDLLLKRYPSMNILFYVQELSHLGWGLMVLPRFNQKVIQ